MKNPNDNPWYVLMTLHGEQTGDEIDHELHQKNRDSWNTFMQNRISSNIEGQLARRGYSLKKRMNSSDAMESSDASFLSAWRKRHGGEPPAIVIRNLGSEIEMKEHSFPNNFVLSGMLLPVTIDFNGSIFDRNMLLDNVPLCAQVVAKDAQFCGNLNISNSYFESRFYLSGSNITGCLLYTSDAADE